MGVTYQYDGGRALGKSAPAWPFRLRRGVIREYGLRAFVPLNIRRPFNMVNGQPLTVGGSPTRAVNLSGPSTLFDAISDYWTVGRMDELFNGLECSVAFIRRKTDATARTSCCFGWLGTTAAATDRVSLSFPLTDGNLYWDFAGFTAGRLTISSPAVSGLQRTVCLASTGGRQVYVNGASIGSNASGATYTPGAELFAINRKGNDFGTGTTPGDLQEMSLFIIADRRWTQAEVMRWDASPWFMVEPVAPRSVFLPAASGFQPAWAVGSTTMIGAGMV